MRSDRIRVREPSEQAYIHPGDKVDARNGEPLQTVVICREKVDAGLRRARQVDRVSRGNAVIPRIPAYGSAVSELPFPTRPACTTR